MRCAAVKDIFEDTRAVAETSGRCRWRLKKCSANRAEGETLLCINSGANTNFDRLQHIAERTELGEQREAIRRTIAEKPAALRNSAARWASVWSQSLATATPTIAKRISLCSGKTRGRRSVIENCVKAVIGEDLTDKVGETAYSSLKRWPPQRTF